MDPHSATQMFLSSLFMVSDRPQGSHVLTVMCFDTVIWVAWRTSLIQPIKMRAICTQLNEENHEGCVANTGSLELSVVCE